MSASELVGKLSASGKDWDLDKIRADLAFEKGENVSDLELIGALVKLVEEEERLLLPKEVHSLPDKLTVNGKVQDLGYWRMQLAVGHKVSNSEITDSQVLSVLRT